MGEATDGTLPKIWFTRAMQSLDDILSISPKMEGGSEEIVKYKGRTECFVQTPNDPCPRYLILEDDTVKVPKRSQDAFKVIGGILVVSDKVRDVLTQFELGASHLVEVPIYTTPTLEKQLDGRFFLLHASEQRDCFVPEESDKVWNLVHRPNPHFEWLFRRLKGTKDPRHDFWVPDGDFDRLVIRAAPVMDVDLWSARGLRDRFFFSDRLKRALDAAQIKTKVLTFAPAIVVP
ncbi:MAG: hypothetical protein AAFQ88_06150 [Pseudomonadota bacterium]